MIEQLRKGRPKQRQPEAGAARSAVEDDMVIRSVRIDSTRHRKIIHVW